MTYELVDVTRRNACANEYYNATTEQFEVIHRHDIYDVVETFLIPTGEILFSAYNPTAPQPFVVGIYGSDAGTYWHDATDARRFFAQRIAQEFGLVVNKKRSAAATADDRVTDLCDGIKKDVQAYYKAKGRDDDSVESAAGVDLASGATLLVEHLQRKGALTREIYDADMARFR
ncbi:hypothetical protein ACFU99_05810 [Streptomyces sp. NPDC057654]|uniref:hypothetical protein n=1 Tax=Streptomyces sp. NPDC057654 TaxID=3346196 RepID=UPI0036C1D45B